MANRPKRSALAYRLQRRPNTFQDGKRHVVWIGTLRVIIQGDFTVIHRIYAGKDGKARYSLVKPNTRTWREARKLALQELRRRASAAEHRLLQQLIQTPPDDYADLRYRADQPYTDLPLDNDEARILARVVTLRPGAGKSGHYNA